MSLIDDKELYKYESLSNFQSIVDANDSIQSFIQDKQKDWLYKLEDHKSQNMPFESHYRNCQKWMAARVDSVNDVLAMYKEYKQYCTEAGLNTESEFWESQFFKPSEYKTHNPKKSDVRLTDDADIAIELFLDKWSESLDKHRTQWELEALNKYREQLVKELEKLLAMFETLLKSLESLGLEPGRWLDLSSGSLTEQEIQTFKHWADYFRNDEGAQAICEKLGRLNEVEVSENIERVSVQHTIQKWMPDVNSREEIVGIKLGRDIEHALPSELALLSDVDTALLFDLKFVEGQLMSYDLQGLQQVEETVEREEDQSVETVEDKGPMILCIDTSGSMHGEPENIAKAMALFLANKARQQGRACYLINFSTGIETLDLSGSGGLSSLIRFLSASFHGGTDAAPALRHALSMMREQEYEKSDLLMISDFVMSGLPSDLMGGIENQRLAGNQFFSLVVGSCFMSNRLETLFDYEWVYNPSNSSITDLVNFHSKSKMFDVKEVNYV